VNTNQEKFLLSEYGNSRIQPYSYSFGKYDIIVPFAYASPFQTFDDLEKKLFDKYLGEKALAERKKYAKLGMKAPKLRSGNLLLIKPFELRNLSDAEALEKITAEAFRRYNKAISLSIKLHNIEPDKDHPVKVGTNDVKKMNAAYNKILLEKLNDKIFVAAAKTVNIVKKQGRFLRKTFARLSAPVLKAMDQKYNKQLSMLKKFYQNNRTAVKTAGIATLGTFLFAGITHKDDKEKFNTPSFEWLKGIKEPVDEQWESQGKTYTLSKYVVQYLDSLGLGLDKLNPVQKHNLELYLATREERDVLIAFAEDFHPVGIDDQKGYGTNGYGSTFKIDEKTGNITRRIQVGEKTTKEKGMKAVDANSDFHFLPHLLTDITVDLSEDENGDKKMVVLNNFSHLTGPDIGSTSFCKALNEKRPINELCQHLARWNVDAGVPKRMFFLKLYLEGKISVKDILSLKPAGCYNVNLEDIMLCYKNRDGSTKMEKKKVVTTELRKDRKGRQRKVKRTSIRVRPKYKIIGGMPCFTQDNNVIAQSIAAAKPEENEKTVADILPAEMHRNILQKIESSQYFAMAENSSGTSYAFYTAAKIKNKSRD